MSTHKTVKYTNCRLVKDGTIIADDLWVRNGRILNPEPLFFEEKIKADEIYDCSNALLCAGFIDVQINGGYGYDFSSNISSIDKAIAEVRKGILSAGVTAFCPTIVTSPSDVYRHLLKKIQKFPGGKDGAEVLGIHIEGPFINEKKKGAHPAQFISTFEKGFESLTSMYGDDRSSVAIITLAPELESASQVIRNLVTEGIVVSLGHSEGNLLDGENAVCNGASFITHLFNAMLPFHHRDPGLVGLLTSQFIPRPVFYGIIADGIHTHPAALRIAHRTHPDGLVLVTDAMAALGLQDGQHRLGQLLVDVCGREAKIVGTDTLAGAIAPMDVCVRHFIKSTGTTVVQGIEAATLHPAKLLGLIGRKGTLQYGSDADFLMLDDTNQLKIDRTFIAGDCVYAANDAKALIKS